MRFRQSQLTRPHGSKPLLVTKTMSKNNYEGIHPYVVNQVRYHARSLMRHSTTHGVEVEDLEQELMPDF